jgi:chromosome partitioning protein
VKVIAIANQKGGVGKTTLCRELSASCALRGYETLVIDCDPQGNLSQSWLDIDEVDSFLSHVLIVPDSHDGQKQDPLPLSETILTTSVEHLDIVPADIRLARFEMQPEWLMHRLKKELEAEEANYDLVFLDCPPQLGKLLTAALYAAEYVIVPCAADAMGLQGLADLSYTVQQIKSNVNNDLEMLGAIMNLYTATRNLSAEARSVVERSTDLIGYVFDTNIHNYSKIAEAPSQRKAVVEYAPTHKATEQLNNLTDEVLEKLNLSKKKIALVKNNR